MEKQCFNLITFNVHANAFLFEKMAEFVSNKKRTIVAIQEKPKKVVLENIEKLNTVKLITDPNNKLVFILPKSMNVVEKKNIKKEIPTLLESRTLEIDLPLEDYSVKIVNIHGFSKNPNGDDKNDDLFHDINVKYKSFDRKIFLGDFNTNPYEKNMRLETRIYANRDFEDVITSEKDVLYNPSWKYLIERRNFKGTLYFGATIPKWNVYDQILISRNLVGEIDGTGVNKKYKSFVKLFHIPNRLGSLSFAPSLGYDKDNNISDHMPVLLTLEM